MEIEGPSREISLLMRELKVSDHHAMRSNYEDRAPAGEIFMLNDEAMTGSPGA